MSSGFAAGVVVTSVLNPYDRALFLSVAKRRPFLHWCNWKHPWQGLGQSVVGRAISSGLWFPMERAAREACGSVEVTASLPSGAQAALAGQLAGGANALLLSPLAIVKYQTWGLPEGKRSFLRTAQKVYRTAGAFAFFRGLSATVWRDCAFGALFGWTRCRLRECGADDAGAAQRFLADSVAAGAATAVSSPFNYARNVQFAQPLGERATSTAHAIRGLWREALSHASTAEAARFVVRRLNVGWGTIRVAVGMGLTAGCFDGFVALGQRMQRRA